MGSRNQTTDILILNADSYILYVLGPTKVQHVTFVFKSLLLLFTYIHLFISLLFLFDFF